MTAAPHPRSFLPSPPPKNWPGRTQARLGAAPPAGTLWRAKGSSSHLGNSQGKRGGGGGVVRPAPPSPQGVKQASQPAREEEGEGKEPAGVTKASAPRPRYGPPEKKAGRSNTHPPPLNQRPTGQSRRSSSRDAQAQNGKRARPIAFCSVDGADQPSLSDLRKAPIGGRTRRARGRQGGDVCQSGSHTRLLLFSVRGCIAFAFACLLLLLPFSVA